MADYLKEILDNAEKFEKRQISYREAKAVNHVILERIAKEYGDTNPMRLLFAQLESCSFLCLEEAKLKHDVEDKKMGLPPGDWVEWQLPQRAK